jgi:glycosyltransferase involved in cell wall biosynthesis
MNIPPYFEEDAYLFYNSDIAAAVADGRLPSGYHHWLHQGWKEFRAGAPRRHAANRAVFTPRFERHPYGVNLFGFLSTPSGLGEVARSCQVALKAADYPLAATDVPSWTTAAPRIAPPREQRYRINLIQQNADMMPLFIRAYGEEVLHGAYNIGFWFWELPSARSDWSQYYEFVDEIWVASEFCRRSFSCLTRLPVVRMPLVIEGLEKQVAYDRPHFGLPDSAFLFGYAFDINSYLQRKNPLALIEAFRREFGDSPEVLLALKQSHGGGPRNDNVEVIGRAISGAPNITILDCEFTQTEIASFHNVLDCFVSPHRSEGFGFNLAESMYLGKPVIATGYSGNVDFMDDRNSYLIDHRLVSIEQTAGPYMKGAVWAEPDIDHLRKLMRRVFEHAGERQNRAAAAAETIRMKFNSKEAGRRMEERFRELGLDQPRVRRDLFSRHSTRATPRFVHPDTPPKIRDEIRALPHKPLISVIVDVKTLAFIDSVRAQWYPYWELCVCADLDKCRGLDPRIKIFPGALEAAVEISTGEYLLYPDGPMPSDFLLEIAKAPSACFNKQIVRNPGSRSMEPYRANKEHGG